jgi:succinate-acetate transporter protein
MTDSDPPVVIVQSGVTAESTEPLAGSAGTQVVHRVADPAPLGLAGFAMTTFALSVSNANIWPAASVTALGLALVYGGGVQLLAGMWEFCRKNTFGAVAFSSYGAFWISYYVLVKFVIPGVPATTDFNVTVGVFLLGWTIFTAYMTIAACRVSGAVLLVFVLLTLAFIFLTLGAFHPLDHAWNKIGGWVGIATAIAAWYASLAGVANETFKKVIFPTYPLSR